MIDTTIIALCTNYVTNLCTPLWLRQTNWSMCYVHKNVVWNSSDGKHFFTVFNNFRKKRKYPAQYWREDLKIIQILEQLKLWWKCQKLIDGGCDLTVSSQFATSTRMTLSLDMTTFRTGCQSSPRKKNLSMATRRTIICPLLQRKDVLIFKLFMPLH